MECPYYLRDGETERIFKDWEVYCYKNGVETRVDKDGHFSFGESADKLHDYLLIKFIRKITRIKKYRDMEVPLFVSDMIITFTLDQYGKYIGCPVDVEETVKAIETLRHASFKTVRGRGRGSRGWMHCSMLTSISTPVPLEKIKKYMRVKVYIEPGILIKIFEDRFELMWRSKEELHDIFFGYEKSPI